MTLLEKLRIIFRSLGWPVFITFFAFYLLFPRNAVAATVEVDGVTFPVTQKVGAAELRLRGTGTLKWAMLVDLYAGAFYLPETAESRDWRGDVGKHLELCYFRKVPAEGFVEASQQHLQERLPPERMNQLQPRLNELYDLFRDVGPGDRYMLTYIPG